MSKSVRERLLKTASPGAIGRFASAHGGDIAKSLILSGLGGAGALAMKRLTKPTLSSQVRLGMGRALGFGLGGLALGTGVMAASKGYEAVKNPIERKHSFDKMLAENPGLKREDKDVVRKSFATLHTFNPMMAKDPTVAGAFVRRALAFKDEGIQSADVKTLSEIRKNLSYSGKRRDVGFLEMAKNLQSMSHEND
jgi:hypothetical protein